uniref:Probable magnesium transporter n=2 Tax=Zea mays TaxID=4577 RepID=A0A804PHV1_MAIZE
MGDWIIGALINIVGSVAINFGTNLLKLGHDQREKLSSINNSEGNEKFVPKSVMHFQTWRIGILFFAAGNCLNFMSFAYAAQSLLAALGSIQFVSNIAFAYFVLNKTISVKVMVATTFIVFGNIFLVSFGNHQSPVYTPEQLIAKYSNLVFVLYCMSLVFVVAFNHYLYRSGETIISNSSKDAGTYWRTMLPFSYAVVSGAIGSCSVLFAKSLSNMLRLTMSSRYEFHSWFTYSIVLLFLCTAGFWMARLNEGLSLFDAILIVPMFQIAWTFFSICTGFVYFQEYQVFDTLRIIMFVLGMTFVFVGISLLAPDDSKADTKDGSSTADDSIIDIDRNGKMPMEETDTDDSISFVTSVKVNAKRVLSKAKSACSMSLGLGESTISASSVLAMPMVSSRTTGFRGIGNDRPNRAASQSSGCNGASVPAAGAGGDRHHLGVVPRRQVVAPVPHAVPLRVRLRHPVVVRQERARPPPAPPREDAHRPCRRREPRVGRTAAALPPRARGLANGGGAGTGSGQEQEQRRRRPSGAVRAQGRGGRARRRARRVRRRAGARPRRRRADAPRVLPAGGPRRQAAQWRHLLLLRLPPTERRRRRPPPPPERRRCQASRRAPLAHLHCVQSRRAATAHDRGAAAVPGDRVADDGGNTNLPYTATTSTSWGCGGHAR